MYVWQSNIVELVGQYRVVGVGITHGSHHEQEHILYGHQHERVETDAKYALEQKPLHVEVKDIWLA